ncbi:GNAT family N-acetyltransferase [Rhodoligotrophos defluvii]|uniref:GNAT family N-acetyltransferase n=1 Tax=Rhodoligotrophos defluvii TaxID=2561934 RepID=UPI0010C9BFAE|nr:GNAT family N-acetyltransferase [Rhodoligotrophos defluvii]
MAKVGSELGKAMLEALSASHAFEVLAPLLTTGRWRRRPHRSAVAALAPAAEPDLRPIWDDLVALASESNPFFEPWALRPAIANFSGDDAHVMLVGSAEHPLGVLPLAPVASGPFPLGFVSAVWLHRHCFDTTPLVRTGCEAQFLAALLDSLAGSSVKLLHWPSLALDTRFSDQLFGFLRSEGLAHRTIQQVERPLLAADVPCADAFLSATLSKKRLREWRRCWRRLEELGTVKFRIFDGPHDAAAWCHDFLTLEATGWKGLHGTATALACDPGERMFFEAVSTASAERGNALVYSLELDGRPVAMTVNYRRGGRVWAFKTAYDDRLANLSPGVLVEIEGTRAALRDPSISWIDACTDGSKSLMNELWPARRPVADLLIATSRQANGLVAPATALVQAYRGLRSRTGQLLRSVHRRRARAARSRDCRKTG